MACSRAVWFITLQVFLQKELNSFYVCINVGWKQIQKSWQFSREQLLSCQHCYKVLYHCASVLIPYLTWKLFVLLLSLMLIKSSYPYPGHTSLGPHCGCIQGNRMGSSDTPGERLPPSLSPLRLHPALTYLLHDKYIAGAKVYVISSFTAWWLSFKRAVFLLQYFWVVSPS